MKFRYGIKTILLVTVVFAIAIPIVLHFQYERRWGKLRDELSIMFSQLETDAATIHSRSIINRNGDSMQIGIATREFRFQDGIMRLSARSNNSKPSSNRFYIQPPGIWVPDIETAVETWDRF